MGCHCNVYELIDRFIKLHKKSLYIYSVFSNLPYILDVFLFITPIQLIYYILSFFFSIKFFLFRVLLLFLRCYLIYLNAFFIDFFLEREQIKKIFSFECFYNLSIQFYPTFTSSPQELFENS